VECSEGAEVEERTPFKYAICEVMERKPEAEWSEE